MKGNFRIRSIHCYYYYASFFRFSLTRMRVNYIRPANNDFIFFSAVNLFMRLLHSHNSVQPFKCTTKVNRCAEKRFFVFHHMRRLCALPVLFATIFVVSFFNALSLLSIPPSFFNTAESLASPCHLKFVLPTENLLIDFSFLSYYLQLYSQFIWREGGREVTESKVRTGSVSFL